MGFSVLYQSDPPSTEQPDSYQSAENFGTLIRAILQVVFLFDPVEQDMDRRIAWAKVQAIMTAWPYWREFHQSTLAKIEAVGPMMGLLSLPTAAGMAGYPKDDSAANGLSHEDTQAAEQADQHGEARPVARTSQVQHELREGRGAHGAVVKPKATAKTSHRPKTK